MEFRIRMLLGLTFCLYAGIPEFAKCDRVITLEYEVDNVRLRYTLPSPDQFENPRENELTAFPKSLTDPQPVVDEAKNRFLVVVRRVEEVLSASRPKMPPTN